MSDVEELLSLANDNKRWALVAKLADLLARAHEAHPGALLDAAQESPG